MKLTAIEITNMHNIVGTKKVDLNNINYFYGNNGAGKSTILQAIQLAILGYIPNQGKTASAIFEHCNSTTLKVIAYFDDDMTIERSWQKSGSSVTSSNNLPSDFNVENIIGNLELPIFNFNEFMGLSANKMKDWFINFLPASDKLLDWKHELTKSAKGLNIADNDLIDKTVSVFESDDVKGSDNLESVRNANAWLKDQQSYLKGEISRTNSTIQSLIFYDDTNITGDIDDIIHSHKEKIYEYENCKKQLRDAESIHNSNLKLQEMIDAITVNDEMIESLKSKIIPDETIEKYQSEFNNINVEGTKLKEENIALTSELSTKKEIIEGGGICPYTKTSCTSIEPLIAQLSKEITNIETTIAENTSKMNDLRNKATDLKSKISDAKHNNTSVFSDLDKLNNDYKMKEQYISKLSPEPIITDSKTIEDYDKEIEELKDTISKLEANKKYNELIDKLTNEKYILESTLEVYKVWAKLTSENGLQTDIMNEPFASLQNDMSSYLKLFFNDDVTCSFVLSNKANSFNFGIIRNNEYISYDMLSSGEKTLYTFALMLCLTDRSSSNLKLLIVDDMLDHLDDNNIDSLFETIQKVTDIQIIIAGVKTSDKANNILVEVK